MIQARRLHTLHLLAFVLVISCAAFAQMAPITLSIDATDAPRRIFHAQLTIPATPGPMTLLYPKWLPGNHRPTGPIANLVNLHFTADHKPLAWTRDDVDMYAFHLNVPAGANAVEASFDFVSPLDKGGRFDPAASAELMILNWNCVLLYPQGKPAADYTVVADLHLPAGWQFGTALPARRVTGDMVQFNPASLVTLIDSPVLAGSHYRAIPLPAPGAPPQELDVAADSAAALEFPDELVDHYKRLMAEAAALFGAHHYRDYHFLLSLSDVGPGSGLEHHESSDDRAPERSLTTEDGRKLMATLLPHEYVHSWNGKYRRPAGLATSDYQQPMKGELLWVYEGLTDYLGELLSGRSGLASAERLREGLALTAASMDHRAGRKWRSLEDTAISAQTLYEAPAEWTSLRRSADFYPESVLIWLEADTIIRRQTNGQRSIDDFCRAFFGPPSGPPTVKTYTLADLLAALNQVAPYDWAGFFRERVDTIAPHAPLAGLENSGWRLVYNETPNDLLQAAEKLHHFVDLSDSLGLIIKMEKFEAVGTIVDVVPGTPAAQAGIGPGMKLLAVNGRKWSPEILTEALRSQKNASDSLDLLIENVGYFKTYSVHYTGGLRFPHLERDSSHPDMLQAMIAPRAAK